MADFISEFNATLKDSRGGKNLFPGASLEMSLDREIASYFKSEGEIIFVEVRKRRRIASQAVIEGSWLFQLDWNEPMFFDQGGWDKEDKKDDDS